MIVLIKSGWPIARQGRQEGVPEREEEEEESRHVITLADLKQV